jgi:hypothetical protein
MCETKDEYAPVIALHLRLDILRHLALMGLLIL